jgi:hypothetical protein
MEVTTHVYLVSFFAVLHVFMHFALVARELSDLARPVPTWGDRGSVVS